MLRSLGSVGQGHIVETGCRGALIAGSVRAQPHIPRYRKGVKPPRTSGGRGSPRAARRRVSYWDVIREGGVEQDRVTLNKLVAAFFLRGPLARSSGDGYRA